MLLSPWQPWLSFRVYILHRLLSCYQNSWSMPLTPFALNVS
jgi:hypothetical protein